MTTASLEPRPPGIRDALREVKSVPSMLRSAALSGLRRGEPLTDVGPILVIPGWATGDRYMSPLRGHLRRAGADVHGWGMGLNVGSVDLWIRRLSARVVDLAEDLERPVHLIGWSVGGLIAREVARGNPSSVASVVTLGTPVVGGPRFTIMHRFYSRRAMERVERRLAVSSLTPIEAPVTAIYSRNDGIVDWRAMIAPEETAENIEVTSTHWRLPFDGEVWVAIVSALVSP